MNLNYLNLLILENKVIIELLSKFKKRGKRLLDINSGNDMISII